MGDFSGEECLGAVSECSNSGLVPSCTRLVVSEKRVGSYEGIQLGDTAGSLPISIGLCSQPSRLMVPERCARDNVANPCRPSPPIETRGDAHLVTCRRPNRFLTVGHLRLGGICGAPAVFVGCYGVLIVFGHISLK